MKHLLIIRFSALGDVLMTVPVLYALAHQYPELHITVLSKAHLRPVFKLLPQNVHFLGVEFNKKYKGLLGLGELYRWLASVHFTHVADFHDVLRSQYLRLRFNLAGMPVAHINKERKQRRMFIKATVKTPQKTSFERYADVLKKLGFPVELNFTSVFGSTKGNLSLLTTYGISKSPEEKWIGIAPFAAHVGKIYPLILMEQIIEQLSRLDNTRVFLFGAGSKEKIVLEEWSNKYISVESTIGKLKGLDEELILMSHLNVMLSMDSSNMHLASLVNIPVVSIWGATHPFSGFLGWRQSLDNTIQIDLECRPCSIYGNKKCIRGDYACMNNIPVNMIVDKIKTF